MSKSQHAYVKTAPPPTPTPCIECSITALVESTCRVFQPHYMCRCIVGARTVDALHTKVICLTLSDRENLTSNYARWVQCGSSSNTRTAWSALKSGPIPKVFIDPALITAQMGSTRAAGSTLECEATH